MLNVNRKIAQTAQNFWNFIVRELESTRNDKTSAIIREILDSNLDTGSNGLKSGVSQIIWESWQPCRCLKLNQNQISIHARLPLD